MDIGDRRTEKKQNRDGKQKLVGRIRQNTSKKGDSSPRSTHSDDNSSISNTTNGDGNNEMDMDVTLPDNTQESCRSTKAVMLASNKKQNKFEKAKQALTDAVPVATAHGSEETSILAQSKCAEDVTTNDDSSISENIVIVDSDDSLSENKLKGNTICSDNGASDNDMMMNIEALSVENIGIHLLEKSNTEIENESNKRSNGPNNSVPDDVILINDHKISLQLLQQQQLSSHEDNGSLTNQSTTNDISDILNDSSKGAPAQVKTEERSQDDNKENDRILPTETRSLEEFVPRSPLLAIHPHINERRCFSIGSTVEFHTLLASDVESESVSEVLVVNQNISESPSEIDEKMKSIEEIMVSREVIAIEVEDEIVSTAENQTEKLNKKSSLEFRDDTPFESSLPMEDIQIKQMQRVEQNKEALEDISEDVEKSSSKHDRISKEQDQTSSHNQFDSVVSLNMFALLESKVKELQDVIVSKDICLAALKLQLESNARRDSSNLRDSVRDDSQTGRESLSYITNSTEYKIIENDCAGKVFDFQSALLERDHIIEQLTQSLQQSIAMREKMHQQGEELTIEVLQLRKQLGETVEQLKRLNWQREQKSVDQRLSEVSTIDLVDDLDCAMSDIRSSRESYERQLEPTELSEPITRLSNQIEPFQKFLTADEQRIFSMVHQKFNDFMTEELLKLKATCNSELKIKNDQYETEKIEKDAEVNRLRQLIESIKNGSTEIMELKRELEAKHSQEMEDLRCYFERKCADLEKHYSEEVFSQQSRHFSNDTGSDLSDQENLPPENPNLSAADNLKRKIKEGLYTSPTHRKITPTHIGRTVCSHGDSSLIDERDPELSADELKVFYQEKIVELQKTSEEMIKKLSDKLKRFEARHADDEFMPPKKSPNLTDETNTDYQDLNKIVAEYDRRLQEQVTLAKQDVFDELEKHIQALLSETASEDSHWPPELILLREKFTAKNQLEIAQLQIKHEDEMAKMKIEFEKQLTRKIKRNSTFDQSRDLQQIVSERDNLKELCNTLRWILCEFVKVYSIAEDDLNKTLVDELVKHGIEIPNVQQLQQQCKSLVTINESLHNTNESQFGDSQSNATETSRVHFGPDVSGILNVIENPLFVEFIKQKPSNNEIAFNLDECLEKLKAEARQMLHLSEMLCSSSKIDKNTVEKQTSDKDDSCEEEDGLKCTQKRKKTYGKSVSLPDSLMPDDCSHKQNANSFPITKNDVYKRRLMSKKSMDSESDIEEVVFDIKSHGNVHFHELKNRLVKSEDERRSLEKELVEVISRHDSLVHELNTAKEQIECLEGQKEMFSEGYGVNQLSQNSRCVSLLELQEKAKTLLGNSSIASAADNTVQLMQLIEDFCREGDRVVEDGKKDRDDLQAQVDAADKQLKGTRQFLEEQAAEREQERDEFAKEIESLKAMLRERDKEKSAFDRMNKEMDTAEQHMKEMTVVIADYEEKKQKLESDLKDSIDKIFVLREIISELETQIKSRNLDDHVLNVKVQELEAFVAEQNATQDMLKTEIETLKSSIGTHGYQETIANLEEQLKNARLSVEQSQALDQLTDQLRDIEVTLEKKTRTLESLHANVCSVSCSSPSEDVSVMGQKMQVTSPASAPPSLPSDEIEKVFEKLARHTRAEEAAIKRIRDLEMQVTGVRTSYVDLQNERDMLQERMSEQLLRISALQSRLDEQRNRAEILHRQGTSDLTLKVHDLQSEVLNLNETLSARDKQIASLRNHLEQSKKLIESQEAELAMGVGNEASHIDKLEHELKIRTIENIKLKEKIKSEMINKLALPDLMETMLVEKNDEIDHLKGQLQMFIDLNLDKQQLAELQQATREMNDGKSSGRTLSDIVSISDFDDPDVLMRRAVENRENDGFTMITSLQQEDKTKNSSTGLTVDVEKPCVTELSLISGAQPSLFTSGNDQAHYCADLSIYPKDSSNLTPILPVGPREINFSTIDDLSSPERRTVLAVHLPATLLSIGSSCGDHAKLSIIREDENSFSHDPEVLRREISEMRSQVRAIPRLESHIESLKLSLDSVTNEKNTAIENLRCEMKLKLQELAQTTKNLTKLQADNDSLRKRLSELERVEAELNKHVNDLKSLENRAASLTKELHSKETEIREMTRVFEEQTNATSNVNAKYEALNVHIDSLKRTITNKDDQLSQLQSEVQKHARNEAEYLEQIKSYEASLTDFKILQGNYHDKEFEVITLNEDLRYLQTEVDRMKRTQDIANRTPPSSPVTKEEMVSLRTEISRLNNELGITKRELAERMMLVEKYKLDLMEVETEVQKLRELLNLKESRIVELCETDKGIHETLGLIDLNRRLNEEQARNEKLIAELDRWKTGMAEDEDDFIYDPDTSESKNVRELLRQTGSINDDLRELRGMLNVEIIKNKELIQTNNEIVAQLKSSREQLQLEKEITFRLQANIDKEKQNSLSIQQQDASLIEAMRLRLEAILETESRLQTQLADEKERTERLSMQLQSTIERSKSRESIPLLKSPPDTPRKGQRSSEIEGELIKRLANEVKLLTAQNERERERVNDLQRVLERERNRFDKEVADRKDYVETMKNEMDRILKENDTIRNEKEHLESKLLLSVREIDSLEARISNLQEAETRRAVRRGQERQESSLTIVELQDLRSKLFAIEKDRDQMQETIALLRGDLERGAVREAKLTEAISKDPIDGPVPEEFVQKLKEMNKLLSQNTHENRQMADTLQFLTEERRILQRRVADLQSNQTTRGGRRDDLEDRANHLFGKYLRVESFRKALVHQKRYLLVVLAAYQESEARALAVLNDGAPPAKQRKSFRAAVLVVIAIERMKFVVRRWQTGLQIGSRAIFGEPHAGYLPRRCYSASTNNWAPSQLSESTRIHPQSPPCRDRPLYVSAIARQPSELQSTSLLNAIRSPVTLMTAPSQFLTELSQQRAQDSIDATQPPWQT